MIEPAMPWRLRTGVALLIALGHLLFVWWIDRSSRIALPTETDDAITVVFLTIPNDLPTPDTDPDLNVRSEPEQSTAPHIAISRDSRTAQPPPVRRVEPPAIRPRTRLHRPLTAVEITPSTSAPSLNLYRADGSLELPVDVATAFDAVTRDDRQFDFQRPGLLEAASFVQPSPALTYEATRFDQHWLDEKDLVTEALEKAVEKTTVTIRIPLPRSPGSKLVCKASLAALAGGCGIVNNGEGYVVKLDDPDTLNPEEDRRCRLWWDQIVGARDQTMLRDARQRYEAQCRKPLAAADEVPSG